MVRIPHAQTSMLSSEDVRTCVETIIVDTLLNIRSRIDEEYPDRVEQDEKYWQVPFTTNLITDVIKELVGYNYIPINVRIELLYKSIIYANSILQLISQKRANILASRYPHIFVTLNDYFKWENRKEIAAVLDLAIDKYLEQAMIRLQ